MSKLNAYLKEKNVKFSLKEINLNLFEQVQNTFVRIDEIFIFTLC